MTPTITRRSVLKGACCGTLAAATSRLWTPSAAFAQTEDAAAEAGTVVVLFLRGAMDGLSAVVPWADDLYHQLRPTIAVSKNDVIDLDGRFGLHPALAPLKEIYDSGDLALVHAVGSADNTRSHFDAQESMERGTGPSDLVATGWLTRHVHAIGATAVPLHAMAWGSVTPASMRGDLEALSMPSLSSFNLSAHWSKGAATRTALETLYAAQDGVLRTPGRAALRALDLVADVRETGPAPSVAYPATGLGRSLSEVATTIRSGAGLTAATIDVGGWDLHANVGVTAQGQMRDRLADLAGSMRAFHDDLGAHMSRTTVVVMSEFGRRVQENGSNGTDHGSGNVMFVMGGGINGGRVHGEWLPLTTDEVFRGDVPVLTDYRDVVGELITGRHASDADLVFPGHGFTYHGLS